MTITRRTALKMAPAGAAAACATAGGELAAAAQADPPMKITILGSGAPAPSLTRKSAGYLIEIGDEVILLDGGPGTQHRLLEAGRRPTEVTHAFYSHLHYDHFFDYPLLLLQRWDMGAARIPELEVFGPPPIAMVTERLIGPEGAFNPDLVARTTHQASLDTYVARGGALPRQRPQPIVREMRPGDDASGAGWTMRVGRAEHFQPYLECLNFRLDATGASLAYSGDSGYAPDLVRLARDCNVLIAMCHFPTGAEPSVAYRRATGNHMDAARVAAEAGVKLLVLSHFSPIMDRPGVKERLLVEMSAVYSGPMLLGEDLMRIPLAVTFPNTLE
jgi:ribonuclease BN (tRNA processing enzyme)